MSLNTDNPKNSGDALVYTDRRRRSNGSGGYGFIVFFILLLVLATAASGWLYFDQVTKNANLRQEVINLNQSMAIVREALQITDETITDENEDRNKKISGLQSEINKLWNLVNKKQKAKIQLLMSRTSSNEDALKLAEKSNDKLQEALEQLQEDNKTFTSDTSKKVTEIEKKVSNLPQLGSLTKKVDGNNEALISLKNSRKALNSRVAKLQQEISLMRNKLLVLENNQPIPSHDLERPAQ